VSADVEVAIVGAGQAGLATSWYLTQAGIEHVVLEASRVAETWRTRRWDSFCLVTPNWTVTLPGGEYRGPDPDGFLGRDALVDHFQRWSDSFHAPVRENCPVSALDGDGDEFVLEVPGGKLRAKRVVVASGGYQRAHLPANASDVPTNITQLLAEDYRNPDAIPPGGVLIVGSGQTGCQIAEELHETGRRVVLACGRAPWAPRRIGGKDVVWWVIESGFWNRTVADLPSPAARLISNVLATGHGGGHDMHHRTLHAKGVELAGHFAGAEDRRVHFADDLAQTVQASDNLAGTFRKWCVALAEKRNLDLGLEMPPPLEIKGRTELDLASEGFETVIWTTGYRPDYAWVRFPVFDEMGFPIQQDGRSRVPGLYFMGVHFQRKQQSAVLHGTREDAELVARHIVESRR